MNLIELLEEVDQADRYIKWKHLVNMPTATLERFIDSATGKEAGLSREKAAELGIGTGRDSARAILRMRQKPFKDWDANDLRWMGRQLSFIARMSGGKGLLYKVVDGRKVPTRKLTSLWIWGHVPTGQSPSNYDLW